LLLTSCTDPGIIPRPSVQMLVEGMKEEVAAAVGCEMIVTEDPSQRPDHETLVNLDHRGFAWCRFCNMVQPPRAKHCRDCNCCVLRNDHHCPFVNNCIAQRNYHFFCGFLFSVACLGFAVVSGIVVWIIYCDEDDACEGARFSETVRRILVAVIGIPTVVLLAIVVCFGIFHCVLVCRGRTTAEVLTGRIRGNGSTLWAFRGRSLLHARDTVRFPVEGKNVVSAA